MLVPTYTQYISQEYLLSVIISHQFFEIILNRILAVINFLPSLFFTIILIGIVCLHCCYLFCNRIAAHCFHNSVRIQSNGLINPRDESYHPPTNGFFSYELGKYMNLWYTSVGVEFPTKDFWRVWLPGDYPSLHTHSINSFSYVVLICFLSSAVPWMEEGRRYTSDRPPQVSYNHLYYTHVRLNIFSKYNFNPPNILYKHSHGSLEWKFCLRLLFILTRAWDLSRVCVFTALTR